MKQFWTHKDNIPEGAGYGQFSFLHFIWLLLTVTLITGFVFVYGKADAVRRITLLRSVGITLIVIDILKMIIIGISPVRFSDYLPLELCSFAAYFIVADSFWIRNNVFPEMLLTMFMPAAIMAILFPTTSTLPAVNFYTIHQFVYHGLIIAYIVARFVNGEIPLTYPGVWKSIFNIILLAAVIYVVDTVFDKNFMFLRDTYGNPLLEVIWKVTRGGFAYTVGLVCFCIIMIHIFYNIFKLIAIILHF